MMEAIRAGFDGISHYMFFGGTNFGGYGGRTVGSSDVFMVTSYDYDAPLNEYRRITDKYAAAKRVSLFTLALQGFLLESEEMRSTMQAVRKGFPFAQDHGEAKSFGLLKAIKTNVTYAS